MASNYMDAKSWVQNAVTTSLQENVQNVEGQPEVTYLYYEEQVLTLFTIQANAAAATIHTTFTNATPHTFIWGDGATTNLTSVGGDPDEIHNYTDGLPTHQVSFYTSVPQELTDLRLNSSNFSGALPDFGLLNFSHLATLRIHTNAFTGSLPTMSGLPLLTALIASNSGVSGPIPDLSHNPLLADFTADGNALSGSIPNLSLCTALEYFTVNGNLLTGSAPDLSAVVNLRSFAASNNWLTGDLSGINILHLTHLAYFDCSYNGLSGWSPNISGCTSLQYCYFHQNGFSGPISASYFYIITSLLEFNCSHNAITGTIPDLSNLIHLTNFNCSLTSVNGYTHSTLPISLVYFDASDCAFPQPAVDGVLADFATGIGGRPANGTIHLEGAGMATPSAAGLVSKGLIVAHGWNVYNH